MGIQTKEKSNFKQRGKAQTKEDTHDKFSCKINFVAIGQKTEQESGGFKAVVVESQC